MFDLSNGRPVQEYSYGYEVVDSAMEQRGGASVRLLKRLDVFEVSPVLKGAGEGTGTIAMKNATLKGRHFARLMTDLDALAAALADDPDCLGASGAKQLADIHAALAKALTPPAPQDDGAAEKMRADYHRLLSRAHLKGD